MQNDNVILFPKWEKELKEKSFMFLERKNYEKALRKINELIKYNFLTHEIVIGKLTCLIELGLYDEVDIFMDTLIETQPSQYNQYLNIYLSILFQDGKYEQLINRVEEEYEQERLPHDSDQIKQLFEMSKQMSNQFTDRIAGDIFDEFSAAIEDENYKKQWDIIERLKKMNIQPTDKVIGYLLDNTIHPVTKTAIFTWLQQKNFNQLVQIDKFNKEISVIPEDTLPIEEHKSYILVMEQMQVLEQKNPTMFHMIEKLLYRYFYVCYPLIPSIDEVDLIARSIKRIVTSYIGDHTIPNEEEASMMEEINVCEALYMSIIDE